MVSEIVAVASVVVAVLSALFSYWGQRRIALLAEGFKEMERKAQRDRLLAKYRDPLLDAAFDVQSRIFNILQRGFFAAFVVGRTGRDHDYGINHTAFVFAQYFGWVEVIRKELRFFDLDDDDRTRQLSSIQIAIREAWADDGLGSTCRLFAGVQRAIGERMLLDKADGCDCLGYADFLDRLRDQSVPVFEELRSEVAELETGLPNAEQRLIRLQNLLIDLLEFHDPTFARFPKETRGKVVQGKHKSSTDRPGN
jgi:hypothetical protein